MRKSLLYIEFQMVSVFLVSWTSSLTPVKMHQKYYLSPKTLIFTYFEQKTFKMNEIYPQTPLNFC